MNRISSIVYSSLRNYRAGRGGRGSTRRGAAGPRLGEMTMPESEIFSKHFGVIDEDDPDDIDAFESDFQNVGKYDKMHEREMEIKKSKLMTQIVKRKYFKCEDPPMLTWAEKEQIRLLHAQDPEEWSADRLSESFPATRETVLRVLRAKWSPKNIKTVLRYDETVQKNWDLFKEGKLPVSAELRVCLEKFKDRKIKPMDVEEIAKKIIKPKPTFPTPKSTLFSSIIQNYQNPDALDDCESDKKMVKQIESGVSTTAKERRDREESMTFDEFLKDRVENVQKCDETTPVDRVLVDEYKNRITENYKTKSMVLESENPVGISKEMEKMKLSKVQTKNEKTEDSKEISLISESESPVGISKKVEKFSTIETMKEKKNLTVDNEKNSMETGIIARHKKIDVLHSDYPEYIKIPSKKFKPGVTYRVEDRYYDDDGEFLYRVPGLKS